MHLVLLKRKIYITNKITIYTRDIPNLEKEKTHLQQELPQSRPEVGPTKTLSSSSSSSSTLKSYAICRDVICVQLLELRRECAFFVEVGEIVDHHSLNFLLRCLKLKCFGTPEQIRRFTDEAPCVESPSHSITLEQVSFGINLYPQLYEDKSVLFSSLLHKCVLLFAI